MYLKISTIKYNYVHTIKMMKSYVKYKFTI